MAETTAGSSREAAQHRRQRVVLSASGTEGMFFAIDFEPFELNQALDGFAADARAKGRPVAGELPPEVAGCKIVLSEARARAIPALDSRPTGFCVMVDGPGRVYFGQRGRDGRMQSRTEAFLFPQLLMAAMGSRGLLSSSAI